MSAIGPYTLPSRHSPDIMKIAEQREQQGLIAIITLELLKWMMFNMYVPVAFSDHFGQVVKISPPDPLPRLLSPCCPGSG